MVELPDQLPGRTAHRPFAHAMSYGRHAGPKPISAREAAVLVWLLPNGASYSIPLITRPSNLGTHAGQHSFPGGAIERGESAEQAAIRECREETGLSPPESHIVGRLTPLYVYASNFWVTPIVAVSPRREPWQPNPDEVAELFEMPTSVLIDSSRGQVQVVRWGVTIEAPCWHWQGRFIWGATAMVLAELSRHTSLLRQTTPVPHIGP